MFIENKLNELKILLPEPPKPVGSYLPCQKVGDILYISGQLPKINNEIISGKIGLDLTIEEGKRAIEIAFLNILAIIKNEIKNLDNIDFFIKLTGYINSAPNFIKQADVMNGASDLAYKIFGDKGKHSRVAIGVSELPLNAACEIEAIVKIKS